jgi:hypothetical protein
MAWSAITSTRGRSNEPSTTQRALQLGGTYRNQSWPRRRGSKTSLSDYEREKLAPPDDVRTRIEEALGVGDWPGSAQGELGWLLTVAEAGRGAPEVSRFLKDAAAGVTVSTETALRAGLEKLRRVREKALAQEAGPRETRLPSTE